jgi:hypothetical protein
MNSRDRAMSWLKNMSQIHRTPQQVASLAAEFEAVAAEAGDTETIRARVHAASANLWATKLDEERAAHERTKIELSQQVGAALVERDELLAQRDAFGQKAQQLQAERDELEEIAEKQAAMLLDCPGHLALLKRINDLETERDEAVRRQRKTMAIGDQYAQLMTEELGVWTTCTRCGYAEKGTEPHKPYIGCISALDAEIKKVGDKLMAVIDHRRDIVEGRR